MHSSDSNSVWQGRVDHEDGEAGMRFHQVIQSISEYQQGSGFSFVGFASDLGVKYNQGRVGARQGPRVLRKAIANLAWHFDCQLFDAGDISPDSDDGEDALPAAQRDYADRVCDTLNKKQFVIGLGGGHEMAWGSYQGCQRYLEQYDKDRTQIGIINFDAHFDLRQPPSDVSWAGSSGTPFYQVAQHCAERNTDFHYLCLGISESSNTQALFDFADKNRVRYVLDRDCKSGVENAKLSRFISRIDALYVTICLDALPASIAPGVSAPAGLGIDLHFILDCLQQIRTECDEHTVRWLMADIAELNPDHDIDNRTAKVAARLVFELINTLQTDKTRE